MSRLIIFKTGSTFPDLALQHGDFEDWVARGLTVPKNRVSVVDAQSSEKLPSGEETAAAIVTGAHEMVTDGDPWIERASNWLHHLFERHVPVLGICFGHQLLARALGGEVGYHPGGREVGMVAIRCLPEARSDPLMSALPPSFRGYASHAQTVLSLPPGATRLASSAFDPNHAVRFGGRQWGVQFHPEFTEPVLCDYIERQRDELSRQGLDADPLIQAVAPSPSAVVLDRFARLALELQTS